MDKYAARPSQLEDLCLADFDSWYTPAKPTTQEEEGDNSGDESDTSDTAITLRDGLGTMKKRKTQLVLQLRKRKTEKYFHRPTSFVFALKE